MDKLASKFKWPAALLIAVGIVSPGCGGGGGAMSLSGGSIPPPQIATVTGNLALPSGQPVTSATTTAVLLDTSQPATVKATIDSGGNFTVTGVPVSSDVVLTFVNGPTTLQAVVPGSAITSTTPVNIGSVNAASTVTAQAILTEVQAGVDNPSSVIATQLAACALNQANSGESQSQQDNDVHDPTSRKNSANNLIVKTANTELAAVVGVNNPPPGKVTSALDGVLAYGIAAGGHVAPLAGAQRKGLVDLQASGKTYTAAQIEQALTSAGVAASLTQVAHADTAQRTALTAFGAVSGITPLEALAIAACPTSAGGFGLTAAQQTLFATNLQSLG